MIAEIEEKRFCPATGKVMFSRRAAGESLRWFKGHRVYRKRKSRPMRAYKCEFCGAYHLTHQKYKITYK
jgi:ribosomal protein L32